MKQPPYVIETIKAFVAIDEDGNEGVCAWHGPTGWLPLISADQKRFEQCEQLARIVAKTTGKPIHVLEFTTRKQVGVIQP